MHRQVGREHEEQSRNLKSVPHGQSNKDDVFAMFALESTEFHADIH